MDKIAMEIKRLMATGMTEAEARETALYDLEIEAGHKTEYDLTADQQKIAKKYTRTGTKKTTEYTFTKRERKPNEVKRFIMQQLKKMFDSLAENGNCENVNLSNIERTIDFTIDGRHFSLTLTEHRPKK